MLKDYQERMSQFRQWLSGKYLDIAETLPKFQGGWIAGLQSIRESQRREADQFYAESRPPQDTSLKLKQFRIIDIVDIDNIPSVIKSINRLFCNNQKIKEMNKALVDSLYEIDQIFINRIGIIAKKENQVSLSPLFSEVTYLEDFPDYVKAIRITLYRLLPSLCIVIFDCFLDEEINKELDKIVNRKYLSNVEFKTFFPWTNWSYSIHWVQSKYQEETTKIIRQAHLSTIHWLSQNLKAYCLFNKDKNKNNLNKFLIINFWVLQINKGENNLSQWLKKILYWLELYNLDHFSNTNTFWQNSNIYFDFERNTLLGINLNTNDWAEDMDFNLFLDSLSIYYMIFEYIAQIKNSINYQSIFFSNSLNKVMKNNDFQQNILIKKSLYTLQRLEVELQDRKQYIIEELETVSRSKIFSKEKMISSDELFENILNAITRVESYLKLMDDSHTAHIKKILKN